MSYGDFETQVKRRGVVSIVRLKAEKLTRFAYGGKEWSCTDKNRAVMKDELADGYEMNYCLAKYCVEVVD